MLASKYRLKKRSAFARVELQGEMFQFPSFGIEILSRRDNNPTLFGFVISTKISKLAVIRNKIKRLLSETIRLNYDKIKPGYDVIFLVKQTALKKDAKVLSEETAKALKNVSILQNNNITIP